MRKPRAALAIACETYLARYRKQRRLDQNRERQPLLWQHIGELIDIRHHCINGVFGANWFAEVRTTHGTFIVKGRVHDRDSRPGLSVARNGFGKIRIGGLVGKVFPLDT